ncbi:MAG: restriction endonuclease subunit S [Burkholderiales bacterium]
MSGLHVVPQTWQWVTLQDVADVVTGNTPSTSNAENYGGLIPFFKPPQLNDMSVSEAPETLSNKGIEKARLLPPKSVLVSCIGILGKTAITKITSATNQQINAIVFESLVQPEYGFYYTQTLSTWLKEHSSATTVAIINKGKFEAAPFPLPPFSEQTRIVAKLEELLSDLDAGVAELKSAQKKLAQYRQSLLKAAVEGALTTDWRKQHPATESGAQLLARILQERRARWEAKQLAKFAEQGKTPPKDWQKKYPEPVQPDTTDLPELPEGWVWATVDQLSLEQRYGSSSKTNEDNSGVPVLRMGNIQDGKLDYKNLKYLPTDHDEFPALFLDDGDLLFNRTNSPELVGKTAVYRSEVSPCSYASYLIAVKLTQSFLPEIASAYINSAYGRHWIKSVVVQQVGQANVNGSKLAALTIPLPPKAEQLALVKALTEQTNSALDQEKNIEISLKQSTAQRQNILRAAFAGQLVPQDPNDEPASVLLERIRAERAQRAATPKARGRKV